MPVRARQLLNLAIFVAGLAFCVAGLIRLQSDHALSWTPRPPLLVACLILALVALTAMAAAWRCYVLAFLGVRNTFREAGYQACLMLVAKYLPVMVAGFVARVTSYADRAPARRVVFATLMELMGATAAATAVGAVSLAGIFAPLAVPFIVAGIFAAVVSAPYWIDWALRCLAWIRRIPSMPSRLPTDDSTRRALRRAPALQLLQWLALAGFVATSAALVSPEMTWSVLIALSGAYALSVVVGILVFFLPGGIGAREATFTWLTASYVGTTEALQVALALRIAMSVLDLLAGLICIVLKLAPRQTHS